MEASASSSPLIVPQAVQGLPVARGCGQQPNATTVPSFEQPAPVFKAVPAAPVQIMLATVSGLSAQTSYVASVKAVNSKVPLLFTLHRNIPDIVFVRTQAHVSPASRWSLPLQSIVGPESASSAPKATQSVDAPGTPERVRVTAVTGSAIALA